MPKKKPFGLRFVEQEIMQRILYHRQKGKSYQKISDSLNSDGIGKRRWSWQTVRNVYLDWQGK